MASTLGMVLARYGVRDLLEGVRLATSLEVAEVVSEAQIEVAIQENYVPIQENHVRIQENHVPIQVEVVSEVEKEVAIEVEKEVAIEAEKEVAIEVEKEVAIEAEKEVAIEAEKEVAIEEEKEMAIEENDIPLQVEVNAEALILKSKSSMIALTIMTAVIAIETEEEEVRGVILSEIDL
jgi:hypothetical protein